MLNEKETLLLADFLEEFGERLGNDGCNDWDWPKDWSKEERAQFIREFIAYNEGRDVALVTDADVANEGVYLANFCVVGLLKHKLLSH